MRLPRIPRAFSLPMPKELTLPPMEETYAEKAKVLASLLRTSAEVAREVIGIARSDAINVCNQRSLHGKTARSAVTRLAALLGHSAETLALTFLKDLQQTDGRYSHVYSAFLGDFSARDNAPPFTLLGILLIYKKYGTCWYGTYIPYDRVSHIVDRQIRGPLET